MNEYRYVCPIEIRYGDIDAQRHVNNARVFTYLEQARISYFQNLGLWDGTDFDKIGFILAELSCTYKAPINYGQQIHCGVRTVSLGNKSIEVRQSIRDTESGVELASSKSVLVAYDYLGRQSIRVPESWRKVVREFEWLPPDDKEESDGP